MHNSPGPNRVVALCRLAHEFASRDTRLWNLLRDVRNWLPILLAVAAVLPTPALAQGLQIPCTLLVQGAAPPDFLTITAVVNCIDPGGLPVTITIDWGDGSSPIRSLGGSVTITHSYAADAPCASIGNAQIPICTITVTATSDDVNTGGVSVTVDLTAPPNPPPVFAGQSSVVHVLINEEPAGLQVTFACTTVTDSSGGVHQAVDLGITCSSNPPAITFAGGVQPVSIVIHTSGPAIGSLIPALHGNVFYALLLPLPAWIVLGVRIRTARSHSGAALQYVRTGMVIALILMFSSCGGGFRQPQVVGQATPPGNYQVTVIDQPTPGQSLTGFVQTSLIVPLTVNQVQ